MARKFATISIVPGRVKNGRFHSTQSPRSLTHTKVRANPKVIFRPEIGVNGKGIVVAKCGSASALYNVGRGYSANDSDECPATKDGSWPAPPKSVQRTAKQLAARASRE